MDWLVLWGVAQGAGVLVYPILENLAKEGAKDFVKDFFKDSLKKVLLKEKDPRQVATGKAIKEFVQQMQQQLKFRCKLSDAETKLYIQEVNKFIREKSVKEILGKAFDITCETLEAEKLKDTWNYLQLKSLPHNFNWEGVTEQYLMKCQEILSDDKDLRGILDSQNLENIEKNTKEIAGIIAPFDLECYQEAIQETYGNLKLDSVDTDGAAYNRLKLWSIFIAQNVREVHQVPQVYELPKEHQKRLFENNQIEAIELDKLESYKQVYIEQPISLILDILNQKQTYKYTVILYVLMACLEKENNNFIKDNLNDTLMRELIDSWQPNSDIYDFIYSCAKDNEFEPFPFLETDYNARKVALEAILKNYINHPQTLPLLRDRALNDPNEQVREFATKKLKELDT